ncbi:MAG TPA: hypothetical protein VN515_04230 [Terriglobales bacterium]|nr:hypothetical protein [Terriglobales bacterium]
MVFTRTRATFPVTAALLFALLPAARAQGAGQYAGPQPVSLPPPIVAPADTPYPGVIHLLADVTDVAHRVVNVQETIPVAPGALTLLYPQWLPGNHSPTGPIAKLAGLTITANGAAIPWVRDRVNVFAFHIAVPDGVASLDVRYQFLAPVRPPEGRISFSSNLLDLSWNQVVLYPAGYFSRDIQYAPAIHLPHGWHFATALTPTTNSGDEVAFQNVPLNTLVDSPLYAGVNYTRIDLSPSRANQVHLDVFADTPAELEITPEELQFHRNLAAQAEKLFRSRHYDHYDFLLTLSNTVGGEGLEHHQSSEDGTGGSYFTDWAGGVLNSDLLAHEYTHSWNGKFRRPADLWTPNFNVPMQDDLLWVYEGLTQYYGYVLTARSGMRTPEETRDMIARVASGFEDSPGRDWRPLLDTTNQPTMSMRAPVSWVSWQRAEDYYTEGLLIWLDADTKIRELSNGKKSLDDFARLFYGVDNGSFVTRTYTFDDVVAALNQVQPFDWASFLHSRVDTINPHPPEDGITDGGYRLVYNDTEPPWMLPLDPSGLNLATSLGFSVASNGHLAQVWWGSPAFKAGMTPDMEIRTVNGKKFTTADLRAAMLAAEKTPAPLQLGVERGGATGAITLNYSGGLRYAHLERVNGTPDRLDDILKPLH